MLLNEWQQQAQGSTRPAATLEQQGRELAALQAENAALPAQLIEALAALQGSSPT